jgi:hypothetical protein
VLTAQPGNKGLKGQPGREVALIAGIRMATEIKMPMKM